LYLYFLITPCTYLLSQSVTHTVIYLFIYIFIYLTHLFFIYIFVWHKINCPTTIHYIQNLLIYLGKGEKKKEKVETFVGRRAIPCNKPSPPTIIKILDDNINLIPT